MNEPKTPEAPFEVTPATVADNRKTLKDAMKTTAFVTGETPKAPDQN